MRYIKYFLLIAITAVFVDFSIVNRETVSLSLFPLPYSATLPQFLLVIICVVLGVLMGGISASLAHFKTKHKLKQQKQKNAALENEVKALRSEQEFSISTSSLALNDNQKNVAQR